MQLSKLENKCYKTNLSNQLNNVSSTLQSTIVIDKETPNPTSFLGNDDLGVSKAYASTQIIDVKKKATEIWNEIENSNSIVILTHKFPDGDALGSGLALLSTLREKFPDKKIDFIAPGNFPKYLKGIPGSNLVITDENPCPTAQYDLAIAVDCDEGLMDGLDMYKAAGKRINIDHHGTNMNLKNNEDHNILLIDAKAPSATEVIYNKLLKPLNIEISPAAAECILTGLLTDTGRFKYAKKPEKARETSEELLTLINKDKQYTADTIMMKLDNNAKESDELKKLGKFLLDAKNIKTIKSKNGKKINYIVLDQNTLNVFKVKDNNLEIKLKVNKLTDRLRDSADTGIVFWETGEDKEVRVSIKSQKFLVDDLAVKNGGGGHKNAAGFGLLGETDEVIKEFISKLEEYEFSKS
jgi:phosphoesterase RecJ-like protein